jgi:hypothetical protein
MVSNKKFLLGFLFFSGIFMLFCCSRDDAGITEPVVHLTDQTVSIAVGNGDNTQHSGGDFLLDWNDDSENPQFDTIPVMHVSSEAPTIENYYDIKEGDPREMIDPVWDIVQWKTVNLYPIEESCNDEYIPETSGSFIGELKVKAIFNYQLEYVAFLFQWDDTTKDNRKNHWEYTGAGNDLSWENWEYHLDYDSDWLAMMFSTWRKDFNQDSELVGFYEIHNDFQQEGCSTTCHQSERPFHLNGTMEDPDPDIDETIDEVSDIWIWDATRTNYGDPTLEIALGGYMFDGYIDSDGCIYGDYNDPEEKFYPEEYSDEKVTYGYIAYDRYAYDFQYDSGEPSYLKNTFRHTSGYEIVGYSYFWFRDEQLEYPSEYFEYIWLDTARNAWEWEYPDWETGSKLAGYVNKDPMVGCDDIQSTGYYADGKWTLEIVRNLETNYPEQDVNLNVYIPAGVY